MSKNLKLAAVEGFTGSFVLAAILVRTLFGTLLSVMSSFAHDGPFSREKRGSKDSRFSPS